MLCQGGTVSTGVGWTGDFPWSRKQDIQDAWIGDVPSVFSIECMIMLRIWWSTKANSLLDYFFILVTCLLESAWYVKEKLDFTERLGIDHSWQCVILMTHDVVAWCDPALNPAPFPRCLLPQALCQNESSCESFHIKCVPPTDSLSCKSKSFWYERFCMKPRFEKKAQDNSEISYCKVNRNGQEEMAQPDYHLSFWCLEILVFAWSHLELILAMHSA